VHLLLTWMGAHRPEACVLPHLPHHYLLLLFLRLLLPAGLQAAPLPLLMLESCRGCSYLLLLQVQANQLLPLQDHPARCWCSSVAAQP
jgi:hypothetical protein